MCVPCFSTILLSATPPYRGHTAGQHLLFGPLIVSPQPGIHVFLLPDRYTPHLQMQPVSDASLLHNVAFSRELWHNYNLRPYAIRASTDLDSCHHGHRRISPGVHA